MAGGVGTLFGPIVGVVALEYISLKLGETAFLNNLVILGTILVFLVLLLPKGIFPTARDFVAKLWHRSKRSNEEKST